MKYACVSVHVCVYVYRVCSRIKLTCYEVRHWLGFVTCSCLARIFYFALVFIKVNIPVSLMMEFFFFNYITSTVAVERFSIVSWVIQWMTSCQDVLLPCTQCYNMDWSIKRIWKLVISYNEPIKVKERAHIWAMDLIFRVRLLIVPGGSTRTSLEPGGPTNYTYLCLSLTAINCRVWKCVCVSVCMYASQNTGRHEWRLSFGPPPTPALHPPYTLLALLCP